MALSVEQERRLALVNDLITTDPPAAAALAERFDELTRNVEEARRPEGRPAAIAGLVHECPPPDVFAGYDQCAHGTWPYRATEVAWLAQCKDRDQELRNFSEAVQREARIQDAEQETQQEYEAAQREGHPPAWEAELAADREPEAG